MTATNRQPIRHSNVGRGLEILREPEPATIIPDQHTVAAEQAQRAADILALAPDAFLHLPWGALATLVGGIAPGQLWYVTAFSGDGKTTFLTSLVLDGIAAGWRVYYLGLEARSHVIRTHFACKTLGLDAGDLLSGAYLRWHDAELVREQVRNELRAMALADRNGERALLVSEARTLTPLVVNSEAVIAAAAGATVLVVDHVDHFDSGPNQKAMSDAVNEAILHAAQEHGLRVIAASQMNNTAIKGNRLLRYTAPQMDYVYMGGRKRQIADGMLGLYRPLKIDGVDKETLARFRDGDAEPREILEPNTMAVSVMKHRLYGQREGQRAYLHVERGRVVDANQNHYRSTRRV